MNNVVFNRCIRALQIFLVLTLILSVGLILSACKCQHNYKAEITREATCVSAGETTYTCTKCGDFYTEEIPASEHKLSSKLVVDGEVHYLKCENCDYTSAESAHEFSVIESTDPSTCTKQGNVVKSCVCGATKTETLPLAPHTYTKTVFDDTEHWTVCLECNAEDATHERIPHNLSTVTTAAECEKAGKTVVSCSDCQYKHTDVLPALNHDLNKAAGFSSSSTGSGHYYKCNRCGSDVAEPHVLIDCDCPDGYNRAATCYERGHQDQQCEVCNWRSHFMTPMTDEHNWSADWTSNGTFHWHVCLNGDGACSAKGSEAHHSWETKTVPSKCEENGREWRECVDCGHEQSGSNKVLSAVGHDYETVSIITPASCTEDGEAEQRCKTCGHVTTAVIKASGHDMSSYNMEVTDVNGHYRQCSVCGFTRVTSNGHTWIDEIKTEATCTSKGLTVHTCEFCKYIYEEVTSRNHSYITIPDSYVDATCIKYGTHEGKCELCGDVKTFIDEHLGYADHTLTYYPAKEMTETEAGNRNYWQCKVCDKYFSSKDCHEELTEDQVFTYPPKVENPQTIAQLIEFAASIPEDEQTYDVYQITATITEVNSTAHTVGLNDGTGELYISVVLKENIETLSKGIEVTLKGNLYRLEDEVMLVDCEIVSVAREEGWNSLFISVSHQYDSDEEFSGKVSVYAIDENDDYYSINSNNYNCLMCDSKLTVYIYNNVPDYNVLQKVIINGKATTVTDKTFIITVTEDIRIELVFGTTNKCSVRLTELDTRNNNKNAVIVDEYVSYTYVGQYNDDGRILANSHLKFTVNNANITGINITYDAAWLELHREVLDNVIKAIKPNGVEVIVSQPSPNKNSQVVITLTGSDVFTALDYFTTASQARVTEIIVNYETLNAN